MDSKAGVKEAEVIYLKIGAAQQWWLLGLRLDLPKRGHAEK